MKTLVVPDDYVHQSPYPGVFKGFVVVEDTKGVDHRFVVQSGVNGQSEALVPECYYDMAARAFERAVEAEEETSEECDEARTKLADALRDCRDEIKDRLAILFAKAV